MGKGVLVGIGKISELKRHGEKRRFRFVSESLALRFDRKGLTNSIGPYFGIELVVNKANDCEDIRCAPAEEYHAVDGLEAAK